MNKLLFFLFSFFTCASAYCEVNGVYGGHDIILKPHNTPQSQWNIPADMPDVYYNDVSGTIAIVDYASVTYYVTIYDDWWNAVITDTKVGGGTIDVSSLSSGDYVIPHIEPLLLQNCIYNESGYMITDRFIAGNHVDANRTFGDVTIPTGTMCEVEILKDARLYSGFKVENGSVFKILPSTADIYGKRY